MDLSNKLFSSWDEAFEAVEKILDSINLDGDVSLDIQLAIEELRERLRHTSKRDWIWVDDPSGVNSWITDPVSDPE